MRGWVTYFALTILGLTATQAYADCSEGKSFHSISLATPAEASNLTGNVDLCLGSVATLALSDPVDTLVVGDPDVVSAHLASDVLVILVGVAEGQTSVVVLGEAGTRLATTNVSVSIPEPKRVRPAPLPAQSVDGGAPVPPPLSEVVIMRGTGRSVIECGATCVSE